MLSKSEDKSWSCYRPDACKGTRFGRSNRRSATSLTPLLLIFTLSVSVSKCGREKFVLPCLMSSSSVGLFPRQGLMLRGSVSKSSGLPYDHSSGWDTIPEILSSIWALSSLMYVLRSFWSQGKRLLNKSALGFICLLPIYSALRTGLGPGTGMTHCLSACESCNIHLFNSPLFQALGK